MTGTIFVTGTAGGLGFGIVQNLLSRKDAANYDYVFTVRSNSSPNAKALLNLVERFNASHGGHKARTLEVDLASLESVRGLVSQVSSLVSATTLPPIVALVLNAAYQNRAEAMQFTRDGVETTFQVNTLANAQLAVLLLPSMNTERARIVYTSSWAHDPHFYINKHHNPDMVLWKDDECKQIALEGHMLDSDKGDGVAKAGMRRYAASKTFVAMWMNALQKRLSAVPRYSNIAVVGVEPGGMLETGIMRSGPWWERTFFPLLIVPYAHIAPLFSQQSSWRTVKKSASDIVTATLDTKEPIGSNPKGLYMDGSLKGTMTAEVLDKRKQDLLWKAMLEFGGIDPTQAGLSQ